MSRSISSPLATEFAKRVTRVGYLVQISGGAYPLNLCDLDTVSWDAKVWSAYSFALSGIGSGGEAGLEIQNLDSAIASYFSSLDLSSATCDVWQVAPSALGASDVVRLGRYMLGACEITTDRMGVRLIPQRSLTSFSPRRRIDPSNGFNFAIPDGTKIPWESELYIVGDERG